MRRLLRNRLSSHWMLLSLVAAALIGLSAASLLVGGLLEDSSETRTLTFTASPAGSISPSGARTLALGSSVEVKVRAADSAWTPGLIVDDSPVALTPQTDGSYLYRLTVEDDQLVQATFAELADNVRQLDQATAEALVEIRPDESRLIFATSTSLLDNLVAGDILANGLDDGLAEPVMVRVLAIDRRDEQVVLSTEPAPLTDVLENASVEVLIPLSVAAPQDADGSNESASLDGLPPPRPPLRAAETSLGQLHAEIGVDLDTWRCGQLTCKVRAEGELSAEVKVGLDWDIRAFDVRHFEGYLLAEEEVTVRLLTNGGLSGSERLQIGKFSFPPVILSIGPLPVWLNSGVDLFAGGTWELAAEMHADATVSATQKGGVRYDGERTQWIREHQETASGSATWLAAGNATLSAYVSPAPYFSVYHFCDVSADFQLPYAEVEADTSNTPWWTLYGGGRVAGVAATCSFMDPYRFEFEVGVRKILAQANEPLPTQEVSLDPRAWVSPLLGLSGTEFTVEWEGFTPNDTLESHLRKPDGSEFPTLDFTTDPNGAYTHVIASETLDPGVYEVWGVDRVTSEKSNVVRFKVAAPPPHAPDAGYLLLPWRYEPGPAVCLGEPRCLSPPTGASLEFPAGQPFYVLVEIGLRIGEDGNDYFGRSVDEYRGRLFVDGVEWPTELVSRTEHQLVLPEPDPQAGEVYTSLELTWRAAFPDGLSGLHVLRQGVSTPGGGPGFSDHPVHFLEGLEWCVTTAEPGTCP